jgi:hypothetical protein
MELRSIEIKPEGVKGEKAACCRLTAASWIKLRQLGYKKTD